MEKTDISPKTQRRSIIAAGFGQNMVFAFVNTFLLMYLITYAQISSEGLAVVTLIITAARVFDAVNDPIMGGIVDKTRTRWGKMRPYILFSAAPVAVLSSLLFFTPDATEATVIILFAVIYILWDIAYTLCDVPFWGLIGAAVTEKQERASVISNVRAIQTIGMGIVILGAPWLARLMSPGTETTGQGWGFAALSISIVGMGMFTLAFFNTRERTQTKNEAVGLRQLLSALVKNKPLFMVLLGSLIGFGRTILQVGGAVFVVMAFNDEGYFTLVGAALLSSMLIASFAAPHLLKKVSDKKVMITSSLAGAVLNMAIFVVGYSNFIAMLVAIFFMGLTIGLFMVTKTTMIADAVDYIERKTGVRNDGISFSRLTFIGKLMSSVGILVFGMVIAMTGYQEGVVATEPMIDAAFFTITVIPAISCLLSAIPFMFYKLDQDKEV